MLTGVDIKAIMKSPSPSEVTKRLVALICEFMTRHGFKHSARGRFLKESGEVQQIVTVSAFRRQSRTLINQGLRLRVAKVQEILSLGEGDPQLSGTYGGLAHIALRIPYFDYEYTTDESLLSIARDIVAKLEQGGLDFLSRNASVEAIRNHYLSDDPRAWLTVDEQERECILAAFDVAVGNAGDGIARLEAFVGARKHGLPKEWNRALDLLRFLTRRNDCNSKLARA